MMIKICIIFVYSSFYHNKPNHNFIFLIFYVTTKAIFSEYCKETSVLEVSICMEVQVLEQIKTDFLRKHLLRTVEHVPKLHILWFGA